MLSLRPALAHDAQYIRRAARRRASLLAVSVRSAQPEGTKAAVGKVALLTLWAGSWDGGPDFLESSFWGWFPPVLGSVAL
jgi:hypothetical protein